MRGSCRNAILVATRLTIGTPHFTRAGAQRTSRKVIFLARLTTMILIAHDIRAVLYFCDLVAVMYLGQIMELGPAEAIATPPFHPYTQALLSAAPIVDSDRQSKTVRLAGSIPNPSNPPSGCPFHTRCPRRTLLADAGKICQTHVPPWRQVTEDHQIFCHLPLETLSEYEAF